MSTTQPSGLSRRTLLGAALSLTATGCTRAIDPTTSPPRSPAPSTTPTPDPHLTALERKHDARLGVYALATATGRTIAYRADERFAFCSTFKTLAAAAVLHRNPPNHLDKLITFTTAEINSISPITQNHLTTGMTIRQLCDAAIRYSDGTAG